MRRSRSTRPLAQKVLILHNVMSDWNAGDMEAAEQAVARMKLGLNALGLEVTSVPVWRDVVGALRGFDAREYLVFNWCEGLDGAPNDYDLVPPLLEGLGFTYTGADAWTLRATTDKVVTKEHLRRHRIPTPQAAVYSRPARNGWTRFPALVKPASEHCSYGITPEAVVDTPEELRHRIEYVLDTWKSKALVEDFIDGVEYNISLWGNGRIEVLPLAAIDYAVFSDYHQRLCSFDAKWDPTSEAYHLTSVQCPAPVDAEIGDRLHSVARRAYRALRLRDYGRVDIRMREGIPYILDVNSNPDITLEGGFARSCRAAGYDFGSMIATILQFAAARVPLPTPVLMPAVALA